MYNKGDKKPLKQYWNFSNHFLVSLILSSYDSVVGLMGDEIYVRPDKEPLVDVGRCLGDVAKYELKVLMHQAKVAIDSLEHQRQSVRQAVETAQSVGGPLNRLPNEADLRLIELADNVRRLENVLNQATCEIEQLELNYASPGTGLLVSWPVRSELVPNVHPCEEDLEGTHGHLPQPVAFWSPPGTVAAVSMQYR
jgi:hypothetical protein